MLPSLFEEQLELESQRVDADLERGIGQLSGVAQLTFRTCRPTISGPDGYLELIRKAKARVSIPVIASLNGVSPGGWIEYARLMQDAGADAIELNIYSIVTDPTQSGEAVEKGYLDLVSRIKRACAIPVAVKLSPFFSAPANFGKRLCEAGANGLVLFNRFYQPDFDIEDLEVVPSLVLSRPEELLLRLHWVAILYGHVDADLAVTGGVHSAQDVLKSMMAGARVAMHDLGAAAQRGATCRSRAHRAEHTGSTSTNTNRSRKCAAA